MGKFFSELFQKKVFGQNLFHLLIDQSCPSHVVIECLNMRRFFKWNWRLQFNNSLFPKVNCVKVPKKLGCGQYFCRALTEFVKLSEG